MAIKKPKIRELGEAIRAVVKGPFTTKFPFEPPDIIPEFRGFPEYQEEGCVRCGACAEVCPARAIEVEEYEKDGKKFRIMRFRYDICLLCGQCGALCTTGEGIEYTNKYAKNTFDRNEAIQEVEDELVECEKCGKIITTRKHLDWIFERLGEKAYANPTIVLAKHIPLGVADKEEKIKEVCEFNREDWYRVLCPECRRAAWMKENFQ
jgi:formate hydrogenlyase subunit 6/NADH:ubiquinone oxidoreductase subunit I